MDYMVLRGFILTPGRAVVPGEVVNISDPTLARPLVARGCITLHTATGAAPAPPPSVAGAAPNASASAVETREPEPEDREPSKRRTPKG